MINNIILVIDDEESVRKAISDVLDGKGYDLLFAKNGQEGLNLFKENHPILIILDLRMPVMDGLEFLRQLRFQPDDCYSIIILTGHGHDEDIKKSFELGVNSFLRKPFNVYELFGLVKNCISSKQAEEFLRETEALRKSEAYLKGIFEGSRDGLLVINEQGNIIDFNQSFLKLLGYNSREIKKLNYFDLSPEEYNGKDQEAFEQAAEKGFYDEYEKEFLVKGGAKTPVIVSGGIIGGKPEKNSWKAFMFIKDITKIKKSEQKLNYLAYHDSLTGLANRLLFEDRLQHAIFHCQRKTEILAILFLDLDRFKIINDVLGHHLGDMVLQMVSERLKKCIRKSDTLCRWGGDEFASILPGIKKPENAAKIAGKIISTLSQCFIYESYELFITASIGIALYPDDGNGLQTLVKNADNAMYQAKLQGKNNYQFFSKNMNNLSLERLTLESKLRKAIEKEELQLYYQPQIDLTNGKIIGTEALIYWPIPAISKVIPPMDFIPLAEETGLIIPLGEWILYTACKQNKLWQSMDSQSFKIAVNLSARQFKQYDLLQTIDRVLEETNLNPQTLELEITESILMQDLKIATNTLQKMKTRGIQIAIDDFGTGYSSLNYLKRFPIDKLKIDQTFIKDLSVDPDDASIVMAVISMGYNLNMQVIAEGVETLEQLTFLKKNHCHEAQGFYFSRPVLADTISGLLNSGNTILF